MKTTLYILIFLIAGLSYSQVSQNTNLAPFVGTWQWERTNQIFKVTLYSDGDVIKGDYEMTNNGTFGVGYKSNKLLIPEIDYYYGYAIYGGVRNNGEYFSGSIVDNVLFGDGIHSVKSGQIKFTIQDSCAGCPVTAVWKVSHLGGIRVGSPQAFTIPTDLILTKVE